MKDLGWNPPKDDSNKAESVPAGDGSGDRPQYPSLRFNGEQAEKSGLTKCEFGEEYEITVRVRVTSINGEMNYPGSGNAKDKPAIDFDVISCDEPKEVGDSAEEESEEESEEPKSKMPVQRKPTVKGPKEAGLTK